MITKPAARLDEHKDQQGPIDWERTLSDSLVIEDMRRLIEEADAEGDENSGKGIDGKTALRMLREELAAAK